MFSKFIIFALSLTLLPTLSFANPKFDQADRDLKIYDDFIDKKRAEFARLPEDLNNTEWVKEKLSFMFEIDQYMRNYYSIPHKNKYSKEEAQYFESEFMPRFNDMDKSNTAELKKLLSIYKWFKISEFGVKADNEGWLLVQHADLDYNFQKSVLATLGELWKKGETNPRNFAYLFDRVRSAPSFPEKKLPQRFGTQGACVGPGKWEPFTIEDPANVDTRRKEMGLEPLKDYIGRFKTICK